MLTGTITVKTNKSMELINITGMIREVLAKSAVKEGVMYAYNPHTTAGLTINEGADPAVQSDIIAGLQQFIPFDFPYKHMEGNSPAHLMTTLVGSSETIFISQGSLVLGTWQQLFFCEFDGPRTRKVHWRILKDGGV